MTPNQTAKPVAKVPVSGLHLNLRSSWPGSLVTGVLTSWAAVISEMCKLLSMKKLQTTPYHPQINGLVGRSHQTIMRMIRKLGKDKKADWAGHLAEIVHAYNATCTATVTGYSPHYLMLGWRPRLLVDFYFPTFRSAKRPPQERPLPNVWMNMWLLFMTNWGPPFRRLRPNWQLKPSEKNGTMTRR